MIESMVTATALNIGRAAARARAERGADLERGLSRRFRRQRRGLRRAAADPAAQRQLVAAKGKWVHYAKIGFEKYFMRKIRKGESEPFYEKFLMDQLNLRKIKEVKQTEKEPA